MTDLEFQERVIRAFEEVDYELCSIFRDTPASVMPMGVQTKWQAICAADREAEARDFYEQQQAEIRAETNIPQHLVW